MRELIDGQGLTLMPGLVEAHAHLTLPSSVDRIVATSLPPAEQHQFITAHNARVLLDHGFTSAFSGGATRPHIEVALRDEINEGWLPGPRIKASSFERGASGMRDTWSPNVEQARKFAAEMIALGIDSLKLVMDGRSPIDPSQWHLRQLRPQRTGRDLRAGARRRREPDRACLHPGNHQDVCAP